jgi:hypothetical protein
MSLIVNSRSGCSKVDGGNALSSQEAASLKVSRLSPRGCLISAQVRHCPDLVSLMSRDGFKMG